MTTGRKFVLGLSALALGFVGLSGSKAAPLTADEFKAFVAADLKFIQDKLSDPAAAGKAKATIKSTAFVLAHLAQAQMGESGADKKQLATLRDELLKIGAAMKEKDYAGAKKLADALKADVKASASAKTDVVKFKDLHDFDLAELMAPFRLEKANGRSFEKQVKDFGGKKGIPAGSQADALALAVRMHALGELTDEWTPATDEGKKTKVAWKKYTKEMVDAAKEAQAALGGKADLKKANTAFLKMDGACKNCHNIFRDDV